MLFSPAELGQDDAGALAVDGPLLGGGGGGRIFGGPTNHVTMHNTSSARAAVEHLLEIDRSRIALVGGPAISEDAANSASLRERG